MVTISLCMIVKNEEDVLARCLACGKRFADEIIVVDTGSADRTKEIARSFTGQVYDFPWIDNFAAARNFSFSKANMQYCMWLDADDLIEEEELIKLLALKQSLSISTDVVMMKYHVSFDSLGKPTFSYFRERLIKNHAGFAWEGEIHEVVSPRGKILFSDVAVSHRKLKAGDPDRNLRIFEKMLEDHKALGPREQFYYARELYYHDRFEEAAKGFRDFLSSGKGWLENEIDACRQLAYCYYRLGRDQDALEALLGSLSYDLPRAELCCDVGKHFFDRQRYELAVFWYELALGCKRNDQSGGFISPDCYGYLPCVQLCVCYDQLGDKERAEAYNERAGGFKPDDSVYLYNKKYFERIRQN